MNSPIIRRIDAAIDKLERAGIPPTLDRIETNLGWRDMTHAETEPVLRGAFRAKASRRLKTRGYVIGDEVTHERFDFWAATPDQIETQWRIERDNRQHVESHEKARRMLLDFLRIKEKELGYPPVPAMVFEDVRRIYAMHGLEPPK